MVPQDVPQLQLATAAAEALPRTGGGAGLQQLARRAQAGAGGAAAPGRREPADGGRDVHQYQAVLRLPRVFWLKSGRPAAGRSAPRRPTCPARGAGAPAPAGAGRQAGADPGSHTHQHRRRASEPEDASSRFTARTRFCLRYFLFWCSCLFSLFRRATRTGKLLLGPQKLVVSPCASAAKQYSEAIFPALQLYRTPSTRL